MLHFLPVLNIWYFLVFGALSPPHLSRNMFLSPNANANSSATSSSRQSSSGSSSNGRASPTDLASGRSTPTVLQLGTVDDKPEKGNGGETGREKGAVAYSAAEHAALLNLLVQQPDSFNSSESSPEWRIVHGVLCKTYYIQGGLPCRSSSILHSHFVEMYSAFK